MVCKEDTWRQWTVHERILLSEHTSDLLREVSDREKLLPDAIVKLWCIMALPMENNHDH
jgi:hypothetical protein